MIQEYNAKKMRSLTFGKTEPLTKRNNKDIRKGHHNLFKRIS